MSQALEVEKGDKGGNIMEREVQNTQLQDEGVADIRKSY